MNRNMKESGADWIGEIPDTWITLRGKDIFLKRRLLPQPTDGVVTCFRDGQVTLRSNRRVDGFTFAAQEHGYQGVRVGDLVVSAMDAFAGAVGISESNGKCSPVYSVCKKNPSCSAHMPFYAYGIRNLSVNGYISSVGKGIRERSSEFRFSEIAVTPLPLPPPSIRANSNRRLPRQNDGSD